MTGIEAVDGYRSGRGEGCHGMQLGADRGAKRGRVSGRATGSVKNQSERRTSGNLNTKTSSQYAG
jgi:hypothetical protein